MDLSAGSAGWQARRLGRPAERAIHASRVVPPAPAHLAPASWPRRRPRPLELGRFAECPLGVDILQDKLLKLGRGGRQDDLVLDRLMFEQVRLGLQLLL